MQEIDKTDLFIVKDGDGSRAIIKTAGESRYQSLLREIKLAHAFADII
jgi:hypothetical protein